MQKNKLDNYFHDEMVWLFKMKIEQNFINEVLWVLNTITSLKIKHLNHENVYAYKRILC